MDGHRRYDDEPKPSWYAGQGQYTNPAPNSYDSGVHERPSGAYRLPEQRENEYRASGESTGSHSQEQLRVPVRGPEYPTVKPGGGTSLADAPPATTQSPYSTGTSMPAPATQSPYTTGTSMPAPATYGATNSAVAAYNEPTAMTPVSRFPAGGRPAKTRRPVSAVVVGVVTLLMMIPVIMLLVKATFDDNPLATGVVPAVLLTLGLPMTGLGLFSLASAGAVGREAWLRPPLVYVPVGLVMILAAGLAVS